VVAWVRAITAVTAITVLELSTLVGIETVMRIRGSLIGLLATRKRKCGILVEISPCLLGLNLIVF
jgi:hypothetical protein